MRLKKVSAMLVIAGVALGTTAGERTARAAPQLTLSAELGPELDTNATRLRQLSAGAAAEQPVASGLLRMVARGGIALQLGQHHHVSAEYGGGGKLFWSDDARSADELVHHADLGWAVRPPGAGSTVVWALGSFYDAYQRDSQRDFRTGAGGLRLDLSHPQPRLSAQLYLGFRDLKFKPNEVYDFQGPVGSLGLRWALTSGRGDALVDWVLGLNYTVAYRAYQGRMRGLREQCREGEDAGSVCSYPKAEARQDLNHLLRAEVSYLGNADATFWYSMEANSSNSFGESLVRHVVGIKFTAPLVWGVFFTAKGVLQLSNMRDPSSITIEVRDQSFISLDQENRSSLLVQLARDLPWEHWALNLRYSLHVAEEESSSAGLLEERPSFMRQTVFLGVRFDYGE